jgi:hypothetical protein
VVISARQFANRLVVRAETRFGVASIYPHVVSERTGLLPAESEDFK